MSCLLNIFSKGIDHWEDDQHFAQQRLNWCNWSLIERVVSKAVLQNM